MAYTGLWDMLRPTPLPSPTPNAAPSYTRRVSTPEPVNVPTWSDGQPAGSVDYGGLLEAFSAANAQQTPAPGPQVGGGLYLPGLSLAPSQEWGAAYQKQATPQQDLAAQLAKMLKTQGGGFGGARGGGMGLAAYGWKGTTGLAGSKGSAKYGLQPQMWSALSAANAAMKAAGLGTFGITEGWRSYSGQVAAKARWTQKGKPQNAATPGRSVHGIGYASDLALSTAQYRWLMANGRKFGLINLPGETWHWQLSPGAERGG
jgi:hypothetical protein